MAVEVLDARLASRPTSGRAAPQCTVTAFIDRDHTQGSTRATEDDINIERRAQSGYRFDQRWRIVLRHLGVWQKIMVLVLAGVIDQGMAEVHGTVHDFDQNPILGARVTFRHLTKTNSSFEFQTDADGKFAVDTIPNGPYYISVSAVGFRPVPPAIFEVHFPEFSIGFQMNHQPVSDQLAGPSDIWGELQTESGPLIGVRVCIVSGHEVVRCQMTNRLGQYGFTVPSGEYIGIIIRGNQVIARKALQLKPGDNSDLLTLEAAPTPQP